jgi:capsular polysaccharide biosynthesis protein
VTTPDLDAEQELDLGRLWAALIARWWLPAAGLVAGAILGYLVSLGGGATWRAQAVVFLGQPLSPSGNAQIQSLATNPSTARQIVRAESTIRKVSADTGVKPGVLRAGISTQAVAGAVAKQGQTPLVAISVKGSPPRKIAAAANELARIVVSGVSGYVTTKISGLQGRIASDQAEMASLDVRLKAYDAALRKASETDKLIILTQAGLAVQRRGILEQDMSDSRNLLSLAKNVEASRVVTHAAAQKVSARSRRNALVVGAFIGLILGLLAALLWEPAVRVVRRSAA